MNTEFVSQVKGVVHSFYNIADNLDRRGIGKQINKISDGPLREAIRAEILLFIFKVIDPDQLVSEERIEYINDCLGTDFTQFNIEPVRKKALDESLPQISVLLPAFMIIDGHLGNNDFSSAYVRTVSFVTIGLLNSKGASLKETVNYCRRIRLYSELVERGFDCKPEIDPYKHIDDDNKPIIEAMVKIDEKINPYKEERKYLESAVEIVRKTIEAERKTDSHIVKENNRKPEMPKKNCISSIDRLDCLIGLKSVKKQIHMILNVQVVNKKCVEYKIDRQPIGMHMIFSGNPGTGKTTVARLIGEIYHDEGILSKGQFIEVSRADLVGKYVGHTAQMVKKAVEDAKGGVLFIDEAYSLSNSEDDFGREAIDTLVKEMEDNRGDLVVIAAGYPALMQDFMYSNPGLRSRFPITVEFPDYSAEELLQIFKTFCSENSFSVSPEVIYKVKMIFRSEIARKKSNFGNARMVRNFYEKMVMKQATRLVGENTLEVDDITEFLAEDLPDRGLWER